MNRDDRDPSWSSENDDLKKFMTVVGKGYSKLEECFGFFCNITVYTLRIFLLIIFALMILGFSLKLPKMEASLEPRSDMFPANYVIETSFLN